MVSYEKVSTSTLSNPYVFPGANHILLCAQSCAATLAQHPKKFKVTTIERAPVAGGQATSISLDKAKYGISWMNDGVQGGSPVRCLCI